MIIRETTESDLDELLEIERKAFGEDEGPEIVVLVKSLLNDPTAKPLLSLIALEDQRAIGHILFTKAMISTNRLLPTVILAPLAVLPDRQNKGIGKCLIAEGLRTLTRSGIQLVFVLGHPDYYPRHGFEPASAYGFEAPYPIPPEVDDAWMVQELSPNTLGSIKGKVLCANAMNRPEYWRE